MASKSLKLIVSPLWWPNDKPLFSNLPKTLFAYHLKKPYSPIVYQTKNLSLATSWRTPFQSPTKERQIVTPARWLTTGFLVGLRLELVELDRSWGCDHLCVGNVIFEVASVGIKSKRLAVKNHFSKVTYYVLSGTINLTQSTSVGILVHVVSGGSRRRMREMHHHQPLQFVLPMKNTTSH